MPGIATRTKWMAGAIVVVGAAVAAIMAWRGARSAADDKYRTQAVDRGDISMTVTATGTISAVTTVQVGSQVSGIIARLHADFNSPVRKGQLLAELDPTPFEAQVEQRRADLLQVEVQVRNAEINFRRQETLLAEKLASQADYDAAQAGFDGARAQADQARAALRQAETNLRYTKILSPIDGVVVDRKYDLGQTVAASFQAPTLFTIAQDLTKMQVQADVDQSDIGRIRVGQPARFTVDAYPEEEFLGRIAQIRLNAAVNQNIITYPVILEVPNPDEKLRPQMTANVTLEVDRVHDVLRVPNAALRFRPTGAGDSERGSRARLGASGPGSPATGRNGGFAAAADQLGTAVTGPGPRGMQTVYRLAGADRLEPVSIRAGITDGRFTQVLDGPIEAGEAVVVGQATAKVDTATRPPGGRMF